MSTAFRTHLITAATTVMAGKKCDCVGCTCHYSEVDAAAMVDAIAPIIVEEATKAVHDDLVKRLQLHA